MIRTSMEQLEAALKDQPDGSGVYVDRAVLHVAIETLAVCARETAQKEARVEHMMASAIVMGGILSSGASFTPGHVVGATRMYVERLLNGLNVEPEPDHVLRAPAPPPRLEPLPTWGWSTMAGKAYHGANSKQEAIDAARVEVGEDASFRVGRAVHPDPAEFFNDADGMIENAQESACEQDFEAELSEGWATDVSAEAKAELDRFVEDWARRYCRAEWWYVEADEVIGPVAKDEVKP